MQVVYCVESLPRLRSVQISFHTNCHKLSLSEKSLIAKQEPCHQEEVHFDSFTLDLTSHSHTNVANSIFSTKLQSSLQHAIPPPDDILSDDGSKLDVVMLVCSFCDSTLTSKER